MAKILEKVKRMSEKDLQDFIHSNEYETLSEDDKYNVLEVYSNYVVCEQNALELEQFIEIVCKGE